MDVNPAREPITALVTGGGGFLGRAIVERLIARGDRVRSLSRGDYPGLCEMGVELVRADVETAAAVAHACRGCDVVFHVAAKAGIWGRESEYHAANVVGTRNVIAGCRARGVRRLVYTSSPSVVFDGRDMEGVDESAPYPGTYRAAYPRTKALAEQAVLAANGPDVASVALRPHLIWGPRDNHLVPRILARAATLRRIGMRDPRIDSVYIDNAAEAHILAADRLAVGSPIAGRAYFVTNGEPRGLWELVNGILAAGGKPPVTQNVPLWLARGMGAMLEGVYGGLRLKGEPRLTRFLVDELSHAHWFDISAARRDLGYVPQVSIDEGLRRLRAWIEDTRGVGAGSERAVSAAS